MRPRLLPELLLSLALLVMATAAQADAIRLRVTGEASHVGSGEPAYREIHEIGNTRHTVQYLDQDGHLLASKQLDYAQGYNTPLYELVDQRFNRRTGSRWQDGQFIVYRQQGQHTPQQHKLAPAADLVIDAGFDHFIREQWQRLLDGEAVPFSFAVADPLVTLDMAMRAVPAGESAIAEQRDDYRYFVASSRNRLIGWAIPDIHVAYDAEQKLLRSYQGLSNITDARDKRQTVLIRYTYDTMPQFAQGEKKP
jgi:hypothetical protein